MVNESVGPGSAETRSTDIKYQEQLALTLWKRKTIMKRRE
jgi:hypothetical protein